MKKIILVAALFSSQLFADKVVIRKPFINVEGTQIGSMYYSANLEVAGKFSMTFKTKKECLDWATKAVNDLELVEKPVYEAECNNIDGFSREEREDGAYTGTVSYL